MVHVIQTELTCDAVEGAGVALPDGLRGTPQLAGDLGPIAPLLASREDLPLLGREPSMHLAQQLARGDLDAGTGVAAGDVGRGLAPLVPPLVATRRAMPVGLVC